MKHLGDVTKIRGSDVAPVNVVIGGSPCQDLSIAGKRAGLSGARSGLFMEQIRVIKELRQADVDRGRTGSSIRPRYMVWENVPGAFSSHGGEDFRAVLEETARVVDPTTAIPRPPKGKWSTTGAIVADGWSLAWRVFDAQFWGVPQRRRRIALIADFGGQSAPEILFERESVSGNTEESGTPGKATAGAIEKSVDTANRAGGGITYCLQGNCIDRADTAGCNGKGWTEDVSYTLNTIDRPAVCYSIDRAAFNQGENAKFDFEISDKGTAPTLVSRGPSAVCYDTRGNGDGKTVSTLTGDHENRVTDYTAIVASPSYINSSGEGIACTLDASYYKGVGARSGEEREFIADLIKWIVRRLTPLECERLQGFPDGWTDIENYTGENGKTKQTTDSARYKALGNSIAIPPWTWVLQRLSLCCACFGNDLTMASLFDGIGGFPLIWERLNGKGSCLWASEIEDFPIAVTKYHF